MRVRKLHSWDVSPAEAVAIQKELAPQVRLEPLPEVATLAAADVSYNRYSNTLFATVVVFRLPDWTPVEELSARQETSFPYRTGLLSFREIPALLAAFRRLKSRPDAVLVDGQGIAHPRRLGLASHLGLMLDLPTVGCAKSRLVGDHASLPLRAGSRRPLMDRGERVGDALRSRTGCLPLFVSPGHRCDFDGAVALVMRGLDGRRLPVPARIAHERVNAFRRASLRFGGAET